MDPATPSTARLLDSYHDDTPRDSLDANPTYDGTADIENLQVRSHSDSTNARDFTAKHNWLEPVARRIPTPIKKTSLALFTWVKGPDPPRQWTIKPIFPGLQTAPLTLLDRWCPKQVQKIWLLIAFYLLWILTFSLFVQRSAVAQDLPKYGAPQVLWCGASLW